MQRPEQKLKYRGKKKILQLDQIFKKQEDLQDLIGQLKILIQIKIHFQKIPHLKKMNMKSIAKKMIKFKFRNKHQCSHKIDKMKIIVKKNLRKVNQ